MNQMNTLLSCMLTAYIIPIAFVYYKYKAQSQETGTRSISSIITSTEPFNYSHPIHRVPPPPPLYSKRDTSSRYVCLSWRGSPCFMNIRDNGGHSRRSSSSYSGYSVLFLFRNKITHITSLRRRHSSQSSVL